MLKTKQRKSADMALLAIATYDNVASYESELEFKKDSILTVLDQTPAGLDGWWVCSYRGRNGIAPANRLQVIGVLEGPEKPSNIPPKALSGPELPPRSSRSSAELPTVQIQPPTSSVSALDLYDNTGSFLPPQQDDDNTSQRSSGISTSSLSQASNNDYSSPNKFGGSNQNHVKHNKSVRFDDQAMYVRPDKVIQTGKTPQLPQHPHLIKHGQQNIFQKSGTPDNFYDDPTGLEYTITSAKIVDSTKNVNFNIKQISFQVPSQWTNAQVLPDPDQSDTYDQLPNQPPASMVVNNNFPQISQQQDTLIEDLDYDIPRHQMEQPLPPPVETRKPPLRNSQIPSAPISQQFTREDLNSILGTIEKFNLSQDDKSVTSNTESVDSDDLPYFPEHKITVSKDVALEKLRNLDKSITERCNYLYKFIHARWKTEASLAMNISGIKQTIKGIQMIISEITPLYCGVSNNSQLESCPDRALSKKIWKHLRVFLKNCSDIDLQVSTLDSLQWGPKAIASRADQAGGDCLTSIVTSCRELQIQQRALSTAVHGNSKLLFPPSMHLSGGSISVSREDVTDSRTKQASNGDRLSTRVELLHGGSGSGSERGSSEIYTRMQSLENNAFTTGDKDTLGFYIEKIKSNADIYDAMCQDLTAAMHARHPTVVIGALCKNAISRGFKLNQISILLHDALQNSSLRVKLEADINQMSYQLKNILKTCKQITETGQSSAPPSEECLAKLSKQLMDSASSAKELARLMSRGSES